MLTALQQVLTLLKLLTLELAANDGAALRINPIGEVLTGDADAIALPVPQLSVVDVLPVLLFSGPHIHIHGGPCLIPSLSLLVSLRQPAILENPFKYWDQPAD